MTDAKPLGVIVTAHARDRLRERFPAITTLSPNGFITREIHDAVGAFRRSPSIPAWTESPTRVYYGGSGTGTVRYVWNEAETRCYPIRRASGSEDRRDEFRETWFVMTVLPRMTDAEIEAARQIARGRKQGEKQRRKGGGLGGRRKRG